MAQCTLRFGDAVFAPPRTATSCVPQRGRLSGSQQRRRNTQPRSLDAAKLAPLSRPAGLDDFDRLWPCRLPGIVQRNATRQGGLGSRLRLQHSSACWPRSISMSRASPWPAIQRWSRCSSSWRGCGTTAVSTSPPRRSRRPRHPRRLFQLANRIARRRNLLAGIARHKYKAIESTNLRTLVHSAHESPDSLFAHPRLQATHQFTSTII